MADEPVGTVYADVKPDASGFGKKLGEDIGDDVEKNKGLFGGIGGKVAGLIGGAFAAEKVFSIGKAAFGAAEESAKIGKQTEAVIKSTGGAAQVSADQIGNLSEAISKKTGVDDEAIQSGANLLLTFTNIKNGVAAGDKVFDRATKTLVDMGAALGTDVSSSAVQLGKALNDPIAGISALSRVGVTFTDEQKDQIKTMVEVGNVAGAQGLILDELGKEFGGSAEAQATASDKAKVAIGNLQESVGGLLVPAVDWFATVLTDKVIPATQSVVDWFDKHRAIAYTLGIVIGVLAAGYGIYTAAQIVSTVATGAWSAATGVATAGQWLLNAALSANPIGLVVIAIGLLVGALVVAYEKVGWFHDAIDAIGRGIAGFFGWVQDHWPLLLAILTGPFGLAVLFITEHWDGIVNFVTELPGRIGRAAAGMWDGITGAFKSAINAIIRAWNGLEFKIPGVDAGPFHIGGFTLGVPDIPLLAAQGAVLRGPTNLIGGEYPGAATNPEIVAPQKIMLDTFQQALQDWSGGSSSPALYVEKIIAADPSEARDELERMTWGLTASGAL
ncbi:MAG: phage tail length tape measure family protein [Ilumatobacteraceae bacterium]